MKKGTANSPKKSQKYFIYLHQCISGKSGSLNDVGALAVTTDFKNFWFNDVSLAQKVMRSYQNGARVIPLRLYPYFFYPKSSQPIVVILIGTGRAINLCSVFHNIYLQALLRELGFILRLLAHSEEGR
jgi:hypothetical protein